MVEIIISLAKHYYDPNHAAVFGSVAKLVKASKVTKGMWKNGCHVRIHTLCTKLYGKVSLEVHILYKILMVSGKRDLADLSSLSKYNDKCKYLLNVIDIFSRYAWSIPRKDKTATAITSPLKFLFENRKPIMIQSGKGIEFVNATVVQYLKRQ